MPFSIELTPEETAIVSKIEFDPSKMKSQQFGAQAGDIKELLRRLLARNAIPSHRIKYWNDPCYQIGPGNTSREGVFRANGLQPAEIYKHPDFLQYLYYFLFGANLPAEVTSEFQEIVGNPLWVTSGDMESIVAGTRQIVRKHQLVRSEEAFYQLALDVGLDQHRARSVRDAVIEVKSLRGY